MSSDTKFVDERTGTVDEKVCAKVHYMPMRIEYNGVADIQNRFEQLLNTDETTKESAVEFRGRPLKGAQIEIPSGYKGIVAENATTLLKKPQPDEKDCLYIRKEFNNMTYWNWDKTPSGMDTPVKLLDWLDLANIIHGTEN